MSVGNPRVEHFMPPVAEAISRHLDRGKGHTDIYNRCYEAVDSALGTNDSYKRKITELEAQVAELSVQKCTMTKVCHWSEDEDGNWFGRCGIGWTFNERPSTPLDHGMKYCPRCAGVLLSETYEEAKANEV